ncbi:MAG: quinone-dependent dihydroorotate dehydrogenase [Elusimicrobiota bacterium]|nr:MAG: quinone-dependent dihydroorotate dehydrogenase [Elusimicrobiota bacterium]
MLYDALKPFLFSLDAERVHEEAAGLMALAAPLPGAAAVLSALTGPGGRGLEKTVFGVRFPNPVGLAAGFDKDGRLIPVLPGLGFGFLEIGSVTLEPQPGNPKPRLFRVPGERAIVNRMGFNSEGARALRVRLSAMPRPPIPLGINLGLNKGTPSTQAPSAYARTFKLLAEFGDYFVVNVSSPNTPGLRDLQKSSDLAAILDAVQTANASTKPVLVKLSPDLADDDLRACLATPGAQGFVVSNTTIDHAHQEKGGLSGAPLKAKAQALLAKTRALTELPLIAVGGIETADDARDRLAAGADLVQLYTGLVYGGPSTVKRITRGLA